MNIKVYVLEPRNNSELCGYLKTKKIYATNINNADVIIVNKVNNIRKALDDVDYSLMRGKEIICIKNRFGREYYVTNHLIKDGAYFV